MISKAEVMPLLLGACPGFEQMWREHLEWWGSAERGIFNDTSEFARYLVECYARGSMDEFSDAFLTIETLIHQGDDEARGAAVVGVLESLQVRATHTTFGPDVFLRFLGPLSREAWQEIDDLWAAAGGSLADVIRYEKGQKKLDDPSNT